MRAYLICFVCTQDAARDAKAKKRESDGATTPIAKKRPKQVDYERETVDDSTEPQLKIPMPFSLKKLLVTDWERIAIMKKRPRLPVNESVCVDAALEAYILSKSKGRSEDAKDGVIVTGATGAAQVDDKSTLFGNGKDAPPHVQLVRGIRTYFESMLGTVLLYASERTQYDVLCKTPSDEASAASSPAPRTVISRVYECQDWL